MSCSGSASSGNCCKPRTTPVLDLDFTKEFCAQRFRNVLGDDGDVSQDVIDGLTIDSTIFSKTVTDPDTGILDQFHYNCYYHEPIYTQKGYELIMQSTLSAKQYFSNAFPEAFAKRIRDAYADLLSVPRPGQSHRPRQRHLRWFRPD